MDFKTMAITATLGGTILLSGLTFTGTIDLADIKGFGQDWANKLTQAVDNSKQMASKFNLFKSDTERLINEKIAKINELNARINELGNKVASGEVNLEDANNEIARLNEELEKANSEVQALKNEFALKDSEVQSAFAEMATADSLDTNLTLDTETTTPTTPEEEPATPEETPETPEEEPTNQYAQKETAIYNSMTFKYANIQDLTVTMTATSVTLSEPDLGSHNPQLNASFKNDLANSAGVTVTSIEKIDNNTYKFNY